MHQLQRPGNKGVREARREADRSHGESPCAVQASPVGKAVGTRLLPLLLPSLWQPLGQLSVAW